MVGVYNKLHMIPKNAKICNNTVTVNKKHTVDGEICHGVYMTPDHRCIGYFDNGVFHNMYGAAHIINGEETFYIWGLEIKTKHQFETITKNLPLLYWQKYTGQLIF